MDTKQLFVLTQDYVKSNGTSGQSVIGVYDVENISEAFDNRRETIFDYHGDCIDRTAWDNKSIGESSFGETYYFDGLSIGLCARAYSLNHHIDY